MFSSIVFAVHSDDPVDVGILCLLRSDAWCRQNSGFVCIECFQQVLRYVTASPAFVWHRFRSSRFAPNALGPLVASSLRSLSSLIVALKNLSTDGSSPGLKIWRKCLSVKGDWPLYFIPASLSCFSRVDENCIVFDFSAINALSRFILPPFFILLFICNYSAPSKGVLL